MSKKSPLECQDCGFEHDAELALLRQVETAARRYGKAAIRTTAEQFNWVPVQVTLNKVAAWRAGHEAQPVSDQEAAERR